ncbi:hypothetical protein [Streptomyces sp. NPDC086787]|uniref:hypothetical protein n=1 Tax=Streptomyces sp. NPDC086787 TaxID=3365759 RepID=UPI00381BBA1E
MVSKASKALHAEIRIRADLDELWTYTQDPVRHQRWDLRFTEIAHLPRVDGEPQRFRYAKRILPFLTVSGTGVLAGEKERPDGTRTSALRFTSPHPLSLIAEGSGYWRYVPETDGVRLLTGYDYRPRWGAFGALADRMLFRPLIGWATAWSFDRLRLWLERGITPERALRNWLTELAVRALVLAVACGGFGLRPLVGILGSLAPAVAFLCPLLLLVAIYLAVFKAPLAHTPAARRCPRTPAAQMRAPCVLRTLEIPS